MKLIGYIIIFFIIGLIGRTINQILFENNKTSKLKKQMKNNEKIYVKKSVSNCIRKKFLQQTKKIRTTV